ncbi:SAM-dependent methyltransferase [Aliidongia dinghuensis]|uniref:SAM-dependent methyltransferase n=1 Tax=Aliidongia dinghuensis TaxID=1867774 RepID=A0A8J2YXV4_9PROT|nr:DUF938 domain-containing protein [Aliidongia dinghuensis]GGF33603.1 SAM-dependent methyltransferase [Aliidongia dinghuensis]
MTSAPDPTRPDDTRADPPIDPRRFAPATERNRGPILALLTRVLPPAALVLEVASGTGEHAVFFGRHLPDRTWQPSDIDAAARASIVAWTAEAGLTNVLAPVALDTAQPNWPVDRADAVIAINMIHIAPWAAAVGLLGGAARVLTAGAPLVLYGPYKRGGRHTAPSNEAFDQNLRRQDPAWGVRDLEAVVEVADGAGLALDEIVEMPANNLSLVFRRR